MSKRNNKPSLPVAADLSWPAERIAKFIDLTPRRLAQLVQEGIVPKVEKGRYNPFEVTVAYIRWLRDQRGAVDSDKDKTSSAAAVDRARRTKAEADLTELERGKEMKMLCLRDDFNNLYADAIARGVRNISKLKGLSKSQKDDVFDCIRNVKLPEPE